MSKKEQTLRTPRAHARRAAFDQTRVIFHSNRGEERLFRCLFVFSRITHLSAAASAEAGHASRIASKRSEDGFAPVCTDFACAAPAPWQPPTFQSISKEFKAIQRISNQKNHIRQPALRKTLGGRVSPSGSFSAASWQPMVTFSNRLVTYGNPW